MSDTAPAWPDPARPIREWHEEIGPVLWWKFPVDEAPFCGDPRCDDWPGYHTHFTPIPLPALPFPKPPRSVAREREIAAMTSEVRQLRLALSAIALECGRCRGEQSHRDAARFASKTALRALGKRGIERAAGGAA